MNFEKLSFGKLIIALFLLLLICCVAIFGIGYKVGVNIATEHWSSEVKRLTEESITAKYVQEPILNVSNWDKIIIES